MTDNNDNVFIRAAKKATEEHNQTVKKSTSIDTDKKQNIVDSKTIINDNDEIVSYNLRLPKSLRKKCQLHRIKTDENMNQLILRLLNKELDVE